MGSIVLTILFVFGKLRPLLASNLMCATHIAVCLFEAAGEEEFEKQTLYSFAA